MSGGNSHSKTGPDLGQLLDQVDEICTLLEAQSAEARRTGIPLAADVQKKVLDLSNSLQKVPLSPYEDTLQVENLEALEQIGQVINSSLDLTTVLSEVMDTIIRFTGAERAFLMLKNARGELEMVVARNWEQESLRPQEYELSRTIVKQVMREAKPVLTTNAQDDPRYNDMSSVIRYSLRSILCQPLILKSEVTGVIYADNRVREGLFSDNERRLLEAIANQAAVAIENAQLYQAVRRHAAELEQRVAERTHELEKANRYLRKLTRLKDEFVANVSHELRTPINSLKLYASLLKKDHDKLPQYIMAIRRETTRLGHIIESLLRLSSLDRDQVKVNLSSIDLNLFIQNLVQDRRPLARSRKLSLNFQRECDIKELQVDPELVTEAVSILLTNAINYTPSGGQILVKTLAASHQDQRMFGVQVSDTGPGIPKEEQSRLFERFFRGKVGQESGISGTGLGLAIVKEIIDRHNGSVDVVSEAIPGKGTTFTIWLPA